jgi:hypothetical protein
MREGRGVEHGSPLCGCAERIQSALRACNPPVLITDAQALLAARAAECG